MKASNPDDGRLSLIELVIVVVLLGIMGTIVAAIFINSWRAQDEVTTVTQATNEGQLVGQALERAVRNGVCMDTPDGQTLRVHTAYPAGDSRVYQEFWVARDTAETSKFDLYMAKSSSTAMPNTQPRARGVTMISSAVPYFALSPDGKSVVYNIHVTTRAGSVAISGSASLRTSGGPTPCWS